MSYLQVMLLKLFFISCLLLLGNMGQLLAQTAVLGRINTEIIVPLSVVETEQMGFGKFVSEMNGGNILLSAGGDRSASGVVRLVDSSYGAGRFVVTGTPGALVAVSLPAQVQIAQSNGRFKMLVDQFSANISAGGKAIDAQSGRLEVSVGATLHVGEAAGNPPGFYTGSYEVVFMYN